MFAVHAITYLCTLITATVLGFFAYKMIGGSSGESAGLLAAAFYVTFTTAWQLSMLAANSEIFMVLPYTIAALLLYKAVTSEKGYIYFLSGIAAGLAPLIKQTGGVVAALMFYIFLLPMMYEKRKWFSSIKACVWFSIGFILPIAAVSLLFYQREILQDAIFWNIIYPVKYISQGAANLSFWSQIIWNFLGNLYTLQNQCLLPRQNVVAKNFSPLGNLRKPRILCCASLENAHLSQ